MAPMSRYITGMSQPRIEQPPLKTTRETPRQAAADSGPVIVYDNDCPFCSRYVRLLRLRAALGDVVLMDARNGGPLVQRLAAEGYDLDEGMVLLYGGGIYHGADCIHMLAQLSGESDLWNRVNAAVFGRPVLARLLYPILRFGRNSALRLLGRPKLNLD